MRTIYNQILLAMLAMVLASACSMVGDIDELEPYHQLTEENTYTTADKVEQALNGVYTGWRGFGVAYGGPSYAWKMAGLYEAYYWGNDAATDLAFELDDYYMGARYDQMYVIISRVNYLLTNIQDKTNGEILALDDARRMEIMGEARIARAMAHFDLLCYFGQHYDVNSEFGIAVVEEILGSEGPARNDVASTYASIIADLEFGMEHAPVSIDRQRFTSSTAKAFLARVLLFKKDYANAAKHANEFIATYKDAGYILEPVYGDIFRKGFASEENIFSPYAFRYDESSSVRGPGWDPATDMLKGIMDEQIGTVNDGDDITGLGYDPRYAYAHSIDSMKNGMRCMKYPMPYGFDLPDNSHFMMRLAELYLIYAEAKTRELNAVDQTAVDMLNVIRERAGYGSDYFPAPSNAAEMLNLVRIEKLCELWAEWGTEYHDMVRYHFNGDIDIKSIRPVVKNDWQLIYPIPGSALAGNSNLKQNPGYPENTVE